MNNTELKTLFYKRFKGGESALVFSQAGFPLPLIGRLDFDAVPSIACRLSMRIRVIGGEIGSRSVTITSTNTDMRRVYDLNYSDCRDRVSTMLNRAGAMKLCGADLLTDSAIPPAFDPHITYTAAVCNAVLDISNRTALSPLEKTRLCAFENEKSAYLTVFAADKGYCVCNNGAEFARLPLPMTGYKFIVAAAKEIPGLLSAKQIQKTYDALKKIFPHITSFADITDEMLETAFIIIKSYSVKTCARYIVSECRRINAARRILKRCDIKSFACLMNESFLAQKHLCADNDPRIFLCDELYSKEGVLCARICGQCIAAIVSEEKCDPVLTDVGMTYESEFGHPPVFCVADSI